MDKDGFIDFNEFLEVFRFVDSLNFNYVKLALFLKEYFLVYLIYIIFQFGYCVQFNFGKVNQLR